MDELHSKQDLERQKFLERWKQQRLLKHTNTQSIQTIHIAEKEKNGSSKYFSPDGAKVSRFN